MSRTKAETLAWLAPLLRHSDILPLWYFTVADWRTSRPMLLAELAGRGLDVGPLVVRSSAVGEDSEHASMAGQFASVLGVEGAAAFAAAVDAVVDSYGDHVTSHQVLVQPQMTRLLSSGVAFTRDPSTAGHYMVLNWHDGVDTAAVTGGLRNDLRTLYIWRQAEHDAAQGPSWLADACVAFAEVEALYDDQPLDIEFAISEQGRPILFQVRPLIVKTAASVPAADQHAALREIARAVKDGQRPHPYLCGAKTIYGVMPDWNPAEIIGIRPRPLALSLYQDMVTNSIWAYQRDNYGYRNLRGFPLMKSFHGLPYIDVRVSFNSFIPADIDSATAHKLVDEYTDRLIAMPALHDKVEFEIVLSCYSFDIDAKLAGLPATRFSGADREVIRNSLRALTNKVIRRDTGLWQSDLNKINELERRRKLIEASDLTTIERIYWLLEDCKRYGTLPFAGLARAGFIAGQILRSLQNTGILTKADIDAFMAGVDSVSSRMSVDLATLQKESFLEIYGHLRPGTYDMLSPRYDEAPDLYFDWANLPSRDEVRKTTLSLSLTQLRAIETALAEHQIDQSVVGLFDFLEDAIRGREYSKFVFSRSLSDAMQLLVKVGADYGFSPDEMTYASIDVVFKLNASSYDPREVIARSIEEGRSRYHLTRQILLPPLLCHADDVWCFQMPESQPNFITNKEVTARVMPPDPQAELAGAIIALPNADPGFDWIFSRRIAGFVTAYGGANSHMAIRAAELELPAVIGGGETLFTSWVNASMLNINCMTRQVSVLK